MLKRHTTRHRLNLLKAVLPIGFNINNVSQTHLQGGPKKQPSSKVFITQPKINILFHIFMAYRGDILTLDHQIPYKNNVGFISYEGSR